MRTVRLTIEYDGTDFNGWQRQRGQRTVQQTLEEAVESVIQEKVTVIGSGRTDSGVHAAGQVAHFHTSSMIPIQDLERAMNARLPDDISVLEAADARPSFHAQFSARRKIYHYVILNRPQPSPLYRRTATHVPYRLNVRRMRSAAACLIGRHDFRSFMAADAARRERDAEKDTRRHITRLEIRQRAGLIHIEVEANGFLYKMVRNIVGTLIAVGSGKQPVEWVGEILRSKDRTQAGDTAPARGLTLVRVVYRGEK